MDNLKNWLILKNGEFLVNFFKNLIIFSQFYWRSPKILEISKNIGEKTINLNNPPLSLWKNQKLLLTHNWIRHIFPLFSYFSSNSVSILPHVPLAPSPAGPVYDRHPSLCHQIPVQLVQAPLHLHRVPPAPHHQLLLRDLVLAHQLPLSSILQEGGHSSDATHLRLLDVGLTDQLHDHGLGGPVISLVSLQGFTVIYLSLISSRKQCVWDIHKSVMIGPSRNCILSYKVLWFY